MAWIVEDRRNAVVEKGTPFLTDDMKIDIANKYFPRYPTKRACLLPALHAIQHRYGWIPTAAMEEVAAFLEITPAEVMDTASFYEEYWLRPKGKYLIQVCRSLSCEICASKALRSAPSLTSHADTPRTPSSCPGRRRLRSYRPSDSCA